tara:strand:- start:1172 stop:2509 length:1338 start_codon:yes stop_codon:yes gene_type:complete
MLIIFLFLGFLLLVFNKNKWQNNVKLLLILFPLFGLIANNLRPYSNLSTIFYDFILIIPIYLSILNKNFDSKNFQIMNANLKFAFLFFILIILAQLLNPFNSIPLLAKLVGLKVWLFYLLMISVGFYYIESKKDVVIICKTLSKIAFIPCSIAILQFFLSFIFGFQEAMSLFYTQEVARAATQNFTKFEIASNIMLMRIPSTFSFPAQFSNYLLFSFVPVLTAINFSKNKERFFYIIIFLLIIFSSIASGMRGMYIYIPIFFIYYSIINSKVNKLILYGFILLFALLIIYNLKLANINYLFEDIQRLIISYSPTILEGGFKFLLDNFFGNGVGTATFQTHYITGKSVVVGPNLNESHFFKVIAELGFFGLVAILFLYFAIIKNLLICLKLEEDEGYKVFISSFIAFYLLMLTINFKSMHIDLFPSNFLIYLFLGIILKLSKVENK